PFLLWRFDSRAKLYGVKLNKRPSDYIRENIVVTTSGMFSAEPLHCTIAALGADRVMFSADYPFESIDEAGTFMDTVPLAEDVRADICFRNAERILNLPARRLEERKRASFWKSRSRWARVPGIMARQRDVLIVGSVP